MYEIERGVKLPERLANNKVGRYAIYPFKKMKVGDSFFVPVKSTDPDVLHKKYVSVLGSCRYQRVSPKKFKAKIVDGGVRCWRVE